MKHLIVSLIEDLEIITGLQREDFHVRPEENGATLYGPIEIKELTKRGDRTMHCQDEVGEAGYHYEKFDAILVHLKGQPARSTRRIIKRMNEELKLPVVVFTNGDPWSFRIYASVAYGAIKSAHLSEFMACRQVHYQKIPNPIVQGFC